MNRSLFFALAVASLTACAVEAPEPIESAADNICCGGACCLIGGTCFTSGDLNPEDMCLQCVRGAGGNATDWTPVDSPECNGDDMGPADAGPEDAGPDDAGPDDAGPEDMGDDEDMGGEDDAGVPDDLGPSDLSVEVDAGDVDMGGSSDSGGCHAAGAAAFAPLFALGLVFRRRRRA
ncbi:MAG: MYXO-CTERM sorting domain-containing protein [Myxococcota bacterium]